MGVHGLWESLRPASERRSIHTLASSFYRRDPKRLLRVGVDASIWLKQCQVTKNPFYPCLELQAFMHKLLHLFNVGVQVLLVLDGPLRPKMKRGKHVHGGSMANENNIKIIAEAFGFQWVKAPAEAEAELAWLQQTGEIDLIISDDADTFVFGATWVMRNRSVNLSGTGAQKKHDTEQSTVDHPDFYTLYRAELIHQETGLDRAGLILMALMSGGDYDTGGVDGCGHNVSHALARCGFGQRLLEGYENLRHNNETAFQDFLTEWREDLKEELRTNSQKQLGTRKKALADKISDDFPSLQTLDSYIQPITTRSHPEKARSIDWTRPVDVQKYIQFVTFKLEWEHCQVRSRMASERGLWTGLILRTLLQGDSSLAVKLSLTRAHASTGFEHEYRLEYNDAPFKAEVERFLIHPDPNEGKLEARRAKAKAANQKLVGLEDEEDEGEEDAEPTSSLSKAKKKTVRKPLIWVHAGVVRRGAPQLADDFEQAKMDKAAEKKRAEERKAAKARGEKASPRKSPKKSSKAKSRQAVASESESEDDEPVRASKASTSNIAAPARAASKTLDDFFSSSPPRARAPSQALSRAASLGPVLDLSESPERPAAAVAVKPKKKAPLSDNSEASNSDVARQVRKSPKKSRAQVTARPSPPLTINSMPDSDDDLLPELPDDVFNLKRPAAAGIVKSGASALGLKSIKSMATSSKASLSTSAASKAQTASVAKKKKAVYIELDDD